MFDFLKRKKKRKDVSIEGVYAGPGQMAGPERLPKVEPVPAPSDIRTPTPPDAELEEVYAGPEMMEAREPIMMAVYAGPDYFNGRNGRIQPVQPGPGMQLNAPYPENYASDTEPESDWREPEPGEEVKFCPNCGRKLLESEKTCLCGYNFQTTEGPKPPENPIGFVYAGPEYFGNRRS